MRAKTPEETHAALESAFNAGDVEAFVQAFEPDALMVTPPGGEVARGRDEIRDAVGPLFALTPSARIDVIAKLERDGLALTHARWSVHGADPDGETVELGGNGTIVSRRQPDGTWLIALDHPLGHA